MSDQRNSDTEVAKRDIPSFIEPRPPLVSNPFLRPRPEKGTNLMGLFEEDSELEAPEWLQVYLRLKPCNVKNNLYEVRSQQCLITSTDTVPMGHGRRTQHNASKMYTFSHIFGPDSNQREIFDQVVKENLKKLPEGNNFTLLTYGASGSGKTYTLMGTVQSPGLVPRSLEYVFKMVDAAQSPLYKPSDGGAEKLSLEAQQHELQILKQLRQVSAPLRDKYRRMSVQLQGDLGSTINLADRARHYVWVSFVEIYKESIYDLLSQNDSSKASSKLRIREDSAGNVFVKGAAQVFVRSGGEAYDALAAGKLRLQVAATGVHSASSRSHAILTITVLRESEDGIRTSCVKLCDLAGCERARHTKNTGTRMQESRAINSSLHVLERCLHMLRRKQKQKTDSNIVPYRESKLTRLLGAGLSGARGEAVSMVVTLNPAPAFAHETRHVLQLAAVAKEIQVNHTIAESTLYKSISQESVMDSSAEVMRLRAENERLHFELVQAQACCRQLEADMEERQQALAATMSELVQEAKELTRDYYEKQLATLRQKMDRLKEEYGTKLKAVEITDYRRPSTEAGTPSRTLQHQVTALMTEVAILEEKLTEERLARARAEDEVQHLRACVDERDGKSAEDNSADSEQVILIEEESEDDDDQEDESLEPTFKKDVINKSILLQQSLLNESKHNTSTDNDSISGDGESKRPSLNESKHATITDNSLSDGSNNTLQQNDLNNDTIKNSSCNEESKMISQFSEVADSVDDTDQVVVYKTDKKINNIEEILKNVDSRDGKEINEVCKKNTTMRGTYVVSNTFEDDDEVSNISLAQFEQLEIASKSDEAKPKQFLNLSTDKVLPEKRTFFEDNKKSEVDLIPKLRKEKPYFDNLDVYVVGNKELGKVNHPCDDRSPSIVKEDIGNNFEPSMIKKLLGESFSKQPVVMLSVDKVDLPKKHPSVDIFEGFDSPKVVKPPYTPKICEEEAFASVGSEHVKENLKFGSFHSRTTKSSQDLTESAFNETVNSDKAKDDQNINVTFGASNSRPRFNQVSIFEQCIENSALRKNKEAISVEPTCKSFGKLALEISNEQKEQTSDAQIKLERPSIDLQKDIPIHATVEPQLNSYNNTTEDFENIYKDITVPRATEFDLLVSQTNITNTNETSNHGHADTSENDFEEKPKYNLRQIKSEKKDVSVKKKLVIDRKDKPEGKAKQRSLRLRRRKNQEGESGEDSDNKLKDIANLQKEFSDVTMDVPAPSKEVKDMDTLEKSDENENVPPMLGIQSCPSKSVTRSRRKLYTPRPEFFEESLNESGESNDNIRISRPSYHRPRARRKL